MITLNKYKGQPSRMWVELYGLSTDVKPIKEFETVSIGNASTYYEMDTKKCFMYDEENNVWHEM